MTSTELDIRRPHAAAGAIVAVRERDIVDGWITVAKDVSTLADYIAQTEFVPKALRGKPAAIAACILTGREMGIGPMASLKSIHMVQGTPSLSSEYKRARALAAGHELVYVETNTTRCVVRGRRAGADEWVTVTWHIDDAKRAKLTAKDVWQEYPNRMLQARATGELCDLIFPDCSLGLATTEELEDGGLTLDDGTVIAAANGPAPAAAVPRTAQRKSRAAAAIETAKPDERTPAAPVDAVPLPGEGDASSPVPDEVVDRDAPASISGELIKAVWSVFSQQLGFTSQEKADARAACEKIIGRKLTGGTTRDLSINEAHVVMDTLNRCGTRDRLLVLMNTGELPAERRPAGA